MKNHQTIMSVAIRWALGMSLVAAGPAALAHVGHAGTTGGPVSVASSAKAQAQDDQVRKDSSQKGQSQKAGSQKAQSLTPVVVTGSRISQADIQDQQPMIVMTHEQIEASGLVTVGDIINQLTIQGPRTANRQSVTAGGVNQGGLMVNMRNLGAARVLVLVNGKRWVPNVHGGVDLTTIPASVIQRVVVLQDGASAIYGSDAVTGVVNLITRKKFDGAELKVFYGQTGHHDNITKKYSFTTGTSNDKGSIILNLSLTNQGVMWDRTRALTRYPMGPRHPDDGWTIGGAKGKFYFPGPDGAIGNDKYVINAIGDDPTDMSNYHLYTGATSDQFNRNSVTMFRVPSEHKSIYAQANYRLFPHVILHSTYMHTIRIATDQAAPAVGIGSSRFSGTEGLISAQSIYNPTNQDIGFFRRLTSIPPVQTSTAHSTHFDLFLGGDFTIANRFWNWKVGFNYNRIRVVGTSDDALNAGHAALAIGPSFIAADGTPTCGTPGNPVDGCIPWNVLSGSLAGASNKALRDYLLVPLRSTEYSENHIFDASMTGDLYQIPFGGELALSLGVQHRTLDGHQRPDAALALTLDGPTLPSGGAYQVNAGYYELAIPLLKDLPLAKNLSFDVAGRWADYSTFGKTFNGKYSFEWKPIEDVLLRGTLSHSFRSPTVNDLFGGVAHYHVGFLDPCDSKYAPSYYGQKVYQACVAALQAAGIPNAGNFRQIGIGGAPVEGTNPIANFVADYGSNPNLGPETAISHTYGIVYSPHQVQGLNLTLDWYSIDLRNTVSVVFPSQEAERCYEGQARFCEDFSRNAQGQVDALRYGLNNAGSEITEGWDFQFLYQLPFHGFGRFTVRSAASYITKQNIRSKGSPVHPLVGWYSDWRLRDNTSLDWKYKRFGATWTVRYFSSLREPCPNAVECTYPDFSSPFTGAEPVRRTGSVAFNDVSAYWNTPWNSVFRIGVNNVFDRKGPITYAALNNSGSTVYNAAYDIDRYFYASYTQKF